MALKGIKEKINLATVQWERYQDALDRGHITYQSQAKLNERFYIGCGNQWEESVKKELEAAGKPWLEENIIFSTINTVLGYQTQSRMDIAYKPREAGDQDTSDIITQLAMFIVDQNKFPWTESQVFSDGLIQQRGYFDIRMGFNDNMFGDIEITSLDPLDVIPDPDAKSYDPADWEDVIVTRWVPTSDIKTLYGNTAYNKVKRAIPDQGDFGETGTGEPRNRFADSKAYSTTRSGVDHVKTLERQWYKLQNRSFWFDSETGDIFPIPDGMKETEKRSIARSSNYEIIKKVVKRIRWTVTSADTVLHDEWSPYDFFTIVPFFPYFRRGQTVGMVDNLIKTQEMINKVSSQILHVVNTTANSGWIVEQNSLTNMETEDLEDEGSKTGLVLEHKKGRAPPQKIEANQIPSGLKDLMGTGIDLMKIISGVSDTFQGGGGPEVSGTAIQSRVQQAAIQLATPLDNLFRTRHLIAERLLKLIQQYYTEERSFLIVKQDDEGNEVQEEVDINSEDDFGEIMNDITIGKYDIVISDVPTQVTFQNSQLAQAIEMRKYGVNIPDDEMILMSTLSRKAKIAKRLSGNAEAEAASQAQMAEMEKLQSEIDVLISESKKNDSSSLKSTTEAANLIAANPNVSTILDSLREELRSGEEDPSRLGEEGRALEESEDMVGPVEPEVF